MRVAIAHPHLWPEVRRGAERYADDLAWYLRGQGHEVELVVGTTGPSVDEQRPDGVVVRRRHNVGMVKLARLGIEPVQAFALTILPELRRQRYDVVHAMVPSAALAARLARTPSVFTFIGHPTRPQFAGRRRDLELHRLASRLATITTALSQASAASVTELFGRRPQVVPPGVRVAGFDVDHQREAERRTDAPRILFSAAPSDRRKGLDLLLRALDHVLDQRAEVRLAVSGQGDPGWALAALGDRADRVAAAVDLLGPGTPEEVPARYREAALTALPAVDEAFGLSLVESLAAGTPVVCTRDGGMTDIVDRPEVGRTFAKGDVDDLARALLAVIDLAADPATSAACARHARRWDWEESIGPLHEALYDEAIGSHRRAGRARRR
jgi:glycosyltransferase involved in cell wall biosynthesis